MICFLDMDGVLTDFDESFKQISGGLDMDQYKKVHGRSGFDLVLERGQPFWSDLDWIDGGKEIVDFAMKHYNPVCILSSAGTGKDRIKFKEVREGKMAWITKHLPQIEKRNAIIVPFSTLKSRHAGPDRVLVDDTSSIIKQWVGKGGIGIRHDFLDWKKTISELELYSGQSPLDLKEIVESLCHP